MAHQLNREEAVQLIKRVLSKGSSVATTRLLYRDCLTQAQRNGNTLERDTFDAAAQALMNQAVLVRRGGRIWRDK